MDTRRDERIRNQQRLRALIKQQRGGVRVFSAHDMIEFKTLASEMEITKPASKAA